MIDNDATLLVCKNVRELINSMFSESDSFEAR